VSSRLWSLLLEVAQARAAGRRPADLVEQFDRDRFVQPAPVDQRTLVEIDRHLLGAASGFESIELSPVAPLGACSIMGHASQNKVHRTTANLAMAPSSEEKLVETSLEAARDELTRGLSAFQGRYARYAAPANHASSGSGIISAAR